MMSASRIPDYRSRSSVQYDSNLKVSRSTSLDVRGRGSYIPAKKRPSSEERKSSSAAYLRFGGPRRSSVNPAEKKILKDPRPLNDKTYQKNKVRDIISFLDEFDLKGSLTEAKLMPPSKKDYEMIFKILYKGLDPQYEIQKFEEDAFKVLKTLNYPFTINKSAFTYVARTNWPLLLGVLLWLMDLNKFMMKFDTDSIFTASKNERHEENAILIPFICRCYHAGVEENEEEENNLFEKIIQNRLPHNIDELEKQHEEKEKLINKAEKELNEIKQLVEQNECLIEEIVKYEEYFPKMSKHIQSKLEICHQIREEKKQKDSEFKKLKEEVNKKSEIYDAQGFDGKKQLDYFDSQKKELLEILNKKDAAFKDIQDSCWEVKMQHEQALDKLNSACEAINELYASTLEIAKNCLNPLENLKEQKVKKIFDNCQIGLPNFTIWQQSMISQVDACKENVEVMKKIISNSRNYLQALGMTQKQALIEAAMKNSKLSAYSKVLASQENQRERELNTKYKKEFQDISKIEELHKSQLKALENLRAEKFNLKTLVDEMNAELPKIKKFKQCKRKELEICMKSQKATLLKCNENLELFKIKDKELYEQVYRQLEEFKKDLDTNSFH